MAENDNGGEKTEDPTPKRLQDARDEGQVAASPDLNTAGLLLVGLLLLGATGSWFCSAIGSTFRFCIDDALTRELDQETFRLLASHLLPLGAWTGTVMGCLFAAAVAICIAQVGFHISLKSLEPKLTRISPLTGFGRLFGLRAMVRLLTNVLKLAVLVGVAWLLLGSDIPHLVGLDPDLGHRMARDATTIHHLGLVLACILAGIAAADFAYQRWQLHQDLMMTKQEVKDEMKQSDGDPLVKGKIRQIQRQMAQKRMMQEVPKADVVITNPTHVAVALRYDPERMAAPVVIAKGYDEVAQRIKAIAAEHGVTMVENVPLARALAKEVPLGKAIPGKWFQAVAEVLSYVYKLRKRAG